MGFEAIGTERLRLRRFTRADMATLLAYRNDPEVARFQSWSAFTPAEAESFLREQDATEPGEPGRWFQFALEHRETGRVVGDCALHVPAAEPRQGEIGITLSRAHQGHGFGTEAVRRLLDFCFDTLALHRVTAVTDARNTPSAALLARVGMRREGHFHQNVWFKGAWGDEYLYAVLRSEWARP